MAHILSDETSLGRWKNRLATENRVLLLVGRAELTLAGALLVAGLTVYFVRNSSGLLITAGFVAFLCVGHFLKIRENRVQHAIVSSGQRGEVKATRILQQALGNDSYIFNDLLVKHGRNSAQIDHLVVSPKGLFVIETKNWRGTIRGDEKDPAWTQVKQTGARPIKLSNPVLQNARHIDVLRGALGAADIDWPDVFSIVLLSGFDSAWEITNQTVPLLKPEGVGAFVASFTAERTYTEPEIDAVLNLFMKHA